jgi:hypothetical protein
MLFLNTKYSCGVVLRGQDSTRTSTTHMEPFVLGSFKEKFQVQTGVQRRSHPVCWSKIVGPDWLGSMCKMSSYWLKKCRRVPLS